MIPYDDSPPLSRRLRDQLPLYLSAQPGSDDAAAAARYRAGSEAAARIRTTMIGAIAAIEDELGSLWGHGLPPDQLEPDEAALRLVFDRLRTRILDLGNAQIRSLKTSLSPTHQDQ